MALHLLPSACALGPNSRAQGPVLACLPLAHQHRAGAPAVSQRHWMATAELGPPAVLKGETDGASPAVHKGERVGSNGSRGKGTGEPQGRLPRWEGPVPRTERSISHWLRHRDGANDSSAYSDTGSSGGNGTATATDGSAVTSRDSDIHSDSDSHSSRDSDSVTYRGEGRGSASPAEPGAGPKAEQSSSRGSPGSPPAVHRQAATGHKVFAPAERGYIGERKYQGLGKKWRKGHKGGHAAGALQAEGEGVGGALGRERGPAGEEEGERGDKGGVRRVVQQVMQKGHWEDVDGVLNAWPGRKDRSYFPQLIKEVVRQGDLQMAFKVFNWVKSQRCYRARTDIYSLLMTLAARRGRLNRVRQLFYEMQEWRCKPDAHVYVALILAHGRAGEWHRSLAAFDEMLREKIPPPREAYNALIHACGCASQWQEAFAVFGRMEADGVRPDLVTFNTLLTALKGARQHAAGVRLFRCLATEQRFLHLRPDTVTLNLLMACCAHLGQVEEVMGILEHMKGNRGLGKKGAFSRELARASNCRPNAVTYNLALHALATAGRAGEARALFEAMLGEGGVAPNRATYNTLIDAYAAWGRHEEARDAFVALQESGFQPDVVSYTSLISAYGRACMPDRALEVAEEMKRKGCAPNGITYGALVDALGRAGRLEAALAMKAEMESLEKGGGISRYPPTAVTYCSLIAACARRGLVGLAETLEAEAHARGVPLNTPAYNALLSVYTLAAARAAASTPSPTAAAGAGAQAVHRRGGLDEDGRLPSDSSDSGASGPSVPPVYQYMEQQGSRSRLANGDRCASGEEALAGGGTAQRRTEGALLGAGMGVTAVQAPERDVGGGRESSRAASYPVQGLASASPFFVAADNPYVGLQPTAAATQTNSSRINSVVEPYSDAVVTSGGRTDSGTGNGNSTAAETRTVAEMRTMTETCSVAESRAGVARVLEAMRQRSVQWDGITYATLVEHAGKCGDVGRAEGLLREMQGQPGLWRAAGRGGGAALEAATSLIHAYGAQGRWGDARDLLLRLQEHGPAPNVVAFTAAMQAACRAGAWADVEATFEEMRQSRVDPDIVAVAVLLHSYIASGQFSKALVWGRALLSAWEGEGEGEGGGGGGGGGGGRCAAGTGARAFGFSDEGPSKVTPGTADPLQASAADLSGDAAGVRESPSEGDGEQKGDEWEAPRLGTAGPGDQSATESADVAGVEQGSALGAGASGVEAGAGSSAEAVSVCAREARGLADLAAAVVGEGTGTGSDGTGGACGGAEEEEEWEEEEEEEEEEGEGVLTEADGRPGLAFPVENEAELEAAASTAAAVAPFVSVSDVICNEIALACAKRGDWEVAVRVLGVMVRQRQRWVMDASGAPSEARPDSDAAEEGARAAGQGLGAGVGEEGATAGSQGLGSGRLGERSVGGDVGEGLRMPVETGGKDGGQGWGGQGGEEAVGGGREGGGYAFAGDGNGVVAGGLAVGPDSRLARLPAASPFGFQSLRRILKILASAGRSHEAWKVCREAMPWWGVQPSLSLYNLALRACAKSRNWGLALEVLRVMRTSAVQPSLLSYKLALSSLVNAGQWPLAVHLHTRLTEEGLKPDRVVVRCLVAILRDEGQYERAEALLKVEHRDCP